MTKTQPTTAKLPKAFVLLDWEDGQGNPIPAIAAISHHSPAQARQVVKAAEFLRLPEEEKVERLAKALCVSSPKLAHTGSRGTKQLKWAELHPEEIYNYRKDARAVLAAMGMGGAKQ